MLFTFLLPHLLWGQDIDASQSGRREDHRAGGGAAAQGRNRLHRARRKRCRLCRDGGPCNRGGSQTHRNLFPLAQQPFAAQVIGIEGGDPHGLAALRVAGPIPEGVVALALDHTIKMAGGEAVTFIGFPRALPPWTVSTGSLSGLKGSALAFQALVEEGHSGGPLLLNGQVIGVVSWTRERLGYAVPASILSVALTGWHIEPRASESMVAQEIIGADGVPMVLIRSGRIPTKIVGVYGGGRVEEIQAPARFVYLAEDLYVEATLVTNARYRQFVEATGVIPPAVLEEQGTSLKPEGAGGGRLVARCGGLLPMGPQAAADGGRVGEGGA